MPEAEQLLVVTTRSRLKGAWLFPAMMYASGRIRRQLGSSTDVVRWASVVAGPTEFWTVTVWSSRHHMQEFMRSGAHDDIMWLFGKWLKSFWLMRWRPGEQEIGQWDGLAFSQTDPDYERTADSAMSDELKAALEHLPWLKAATNAEGAATYESTAFARRRRAEVGGAGGVMIVLHPHDLQHLPAAYMDARKLRIAAKKDHSFLRAAVGYGKPPGIYLLLLWKTREGTEAMLHSDLLAEVLKRWEGWANEWLPENEFGHWDGMRLRRARRRQAIKVPELALRSARLPGDAAAEA
ncbi:MAG: hypothetical protein ACRDYC_03540 [Acidimicrobiales bacterium]